MGATDWTVEATITTVDTEYDDTALAGRVTALETLVGSTAVVTQIANAIAACGEPISIPGDMDLLLKAFADNGIVVD